MARRRSFTAGYKVDAVKYAVQCGTSAAARKFDICDRMVRKWKVDVEKLQGCDKKKRAFRRSGPKDSKMEKQLVDWILDLRTKSRAVLVKDVRNKAMEISEDLKFVASAGWFRRFSKRSGIVLRRRTSVGQPLPDDHKAKIKEFRRFCEEETLNVLPADLGNADEVPVPFDMVYERTVEVKGKDDVKIDSTGHEKSNFTVFLAVTADGAKLKPLIIFKKKLLPKGQFPEDVVIKVNEKGWMTTEILQEWVMEVWQKRQNPELDPCKSLLILDSARSHLTQASKDTIQQVSKLAVIPGGLTKHLQPLDVAVNKPFKDRLKKAWELWMQDETKAQYTKGGRRKRCSYEEVASMVHDSFYSIEAETIQNGFIKALERDPHDDDMEI